MRVLIDTHIFLWFISDRSKLGNRLPPLLEKSGSSPEISIASLWEISIKTVQGKLSVDGGFNAVQTDLENAAIQILPISFEHLLVNNSLPFHHRDPFDRMITAPALVEGIDLVSRDEVFDRYFEGSEVKRIWQ